MDYYQVLGVAPDASAEEIERAYRALARQVHPDRNVGDASAEDRMKQLNEIRATLSDPLLRSAYDDQQRAAAPPVAEATPAEPAPVPVPWPVGVPRRTRRSRWMPVGRAALLAAAVISLIGLVGGRDFRRWLGDQYDELVGPPEARPPVARPEPATADTAERRRPPASGARPQRPRGVVKLGSTAAQVLHAFGPPDRVEPGAGGESVMVYRGLRLQLRNGVVVGGTQ